MTQPKNDAKPPRRIGYARVSTASQSTDQQVYNLQKAGCHQTFIDQGISATAKKRLGLQKACNTLKEDDIFVVWAIDRAFRSTIEAIQFLDGLMERGVAFQSLTQKIDTRTPEGRKWFIDTASWAEYERAIISRRTKEKMAEAKRQGICLGRPSKLNNRQIADACEAVKDGVCIREVARKYSVSSITIKRILTKNSK